MKYHILLLEDVLNHGRKGDLVFVPPGFARNFLLPQGKALLASNSTIKMREKLQTERSEQAEKDKKTSLELASRLKGVMLETVVKVDPDGHLYGSVTVADIVDLLAKSGYEVDKKSIALHHPIKVIGNHHIPLKLPEGVEAAVGLSVKPDREIKKKPSHREEAAETDPIDQVVDAIEEIEGSA
jgi:large subunit ribosomal protein L9